MNSELLRIDFDRSEAGEYHSHQRAHNTDTRRLDRVSWLGWVVMMADSAKQHRVRLAYDPDRDEYVGDCTCKHVRYAKNDLLMPCTHLWTVRKVEDTPGETIAYAEANPHHCPTCGRPREGDQ